MSKIATVFPYIKTRVPRICAKTKQRHSLTLSSPLRSIVTHISPTTSLLRSNAKDNEVYLLGTAHVSDASTQEVVELIRLVQPATVFVELDPARAAQLRNRSGTENDHAESAPFDITNLTSHPLLSGVLGKAAGLPPNFSQILESAPALLKRIGWFPPQGGEMKAALEEADRIGARCVYGDVEFSQTMRELKGAVGSMALNPAQLANIPYPPSELKSIFGGLLSGQNDPKKIIEMIKTRERAQQVTSYLRQCFPSCYHIMVTKRDEHMAKMLRQHCSDGKVVAVVGLAHVEGIEREWEELDTK